MVIKHDVLINGAQFKNVLFSDQLRQYLIDMFENMIGHSLSANEYVSVKKATYLDGHLILTIFIAYDGIFNTNAYRTIIYENSNLIKEPSYNGMISINYYSGSAGSCKIISYDYARKIDHDCNELVISCINSCVCMSINDCYQSDALLINNASLDILGTPVNSYNKRRGTGYFNKYVRVNKECMLAFCDHIIYQVIQIWKDACL